MDTKPENLLRIPVTIDVRHLAVAELTQLHQALVAEIERRRNVVAEIEKQDEAKDNLVTIGGFHFEAGTRNFAEWSECLINDTGMPLSDALLNVTWQKVLAAMKEAGLDIQVEDTEAR